MKIKNMLFPIAAIFFIFATLLVSASDLNNTGNETLEINETLDINESAPIEQDVTFENESMINETIIVNETAVINETLNITENNETEEKNLFEIVFDALAESGSYILRMFGIGLQGAVIQNNNYSARFSSTPFQPGTRNALGASYSANIGLFSGTSATQQLTPIIDSYSIFPETAGTGSSIRFYVSARNAESLWMILTLPDGTNETLTLANNAYTYYTANTAGRYNATFNANSSWGLLTSVFDYFEIYAQSQQSGGRGRSESSTCTIIWDCSAWSICHNGIQTRECKDSGTCAGKSDQYKPKESRNCSEALFDIKLELDNIEILEGGLLKFDISMIETKDLEKIDVEIRYSIIDKNGESILDETETKAVEKYLYYQKVMDISSLDEGDYAIKAEIIYGNMQKAVSEHEFRIIKEGALAGGYIIKEQEKSSQNLKLIARIILMLGLITAITLLVRKIAISKKIKKSNNSLSGLTDKKVFSENGNIIGKIIEVYIKNNRIDGWMIKPSKETAKMTANKNIYLKHTLDKEHAKFVGDVLIIKGNIEKYFKDLNSQS